MTKWYEDYAEEDESDLQVEEYDITSSPNDFNVLTIHSFIESGAVRIPGFQRNYVWDISRASKLIESLILGLPVPQIFLYEVKRNEFWVIDGQQRLMSIYYFIKQRFPRKDKRAELREIFDANAGIPDRIIHDDEYFENFRLKLPQSLPNRPNRFKDLAYNTLDNYKSQFDLRTIRNVIVKQSSPSDDDSSMFEVFNRLNTGSVNLRPQEIRMSMYHSDFYDALNRINGDRRWRRLLGNLAPDLHMKDIEILLRAFAMLLNGDDYAPSMVKFLNQFSRRMRSNTSEMNSYLRDLASSFLEASSELDEASFVRHGRFNVALFEAVFVATCSQPLEKRRFVTHRLQASEIKKLENDQAFVNALTEGTTKSDNVRTRINRARAFIATNGN